jgi:glycerate kinase
MNILIATDSFKDALSAPEVCEAIAKGLKQAHPDIRAILFPMADGGEGTAQILTHHSKGQWLSTQVKDPLLRPIEAAYGLSADKHTAFIEMAAASGLPLLKPEERNPLNTSTYGTGELILDAIKQGAKRIILGIGGSATHDIGIGMATALGFRFKDQSNNPVVPVGAALSDISYIDDQALKFDPKAITVDVLCDVDNPLYGERGAAHVYAPQKGADDIQVQGLEKGSRHFANILEKYTNRDIASITGAGAAGGLGAGALAFLNAKLKPGIEAVMELTQFEAAVAKADLIITGEGRIDDQTLHGKLIAGITQIAQTKHVPVIALCGSLQASTSTIQTLGLKAAFSIQQKPVSLETALSETASALEHTAFNIGRLL